MADFEPGQLVECVDGEFAPKEWPFIPNRPVARGRYTIRDMARGGRGVGLLLVEIHNPLIYVFSASKPERGMWRMEPPFLATRFRLVPPTNIEALRALLKVDDLADA